MEMKYKLAVAAALAASALLSTSVSAAPVTCPNPQGTHSNTYTVDPATDCVWGNGNIGQGGGGDEFLLGNGTNDAAYGNTGPTFGKTWVIIDSSGTATGAIDGITLVVDGGLQSATWTLTDDDFAFYALGVKDGNEPQWAVFLLAGTSGTVSMTGGTFSHFVLYGSGTPVSEPGVLGLLGLSLLMMGFLRRRKTA